MIRKVEIGGDVDPLDRIHLDGDIQGHAAGSGGGLAAVLAEPAMRWQAYQPSKARAFSMRSMRPLRSTSARSKRQGTRAVGHLGEEAAGGGADPRPLPRRDRLGGMRAPGLHLDEDDLARQLDHEVELALGTAPARRPDRVRLRRGSGAATASSAARPEW